MINSFELERKDRINKWNNVFSPQLCFQIVIWMLQNICLTCLLIIPDNEHFSIQLAIRPLVRSHSFLQIPQELVLTSISSLYGRAQSELLNPSQPSVLGAHYQLIRVVVQGGCCHPAVEPWNLRYNPGPLKVPTPWIGLINHIHMYSNIQLILSGLHGQLDFFLGPFSQKSKVLTSWELL